MDDSRIKQPGGGISSWLRGVSQKIRQVDWRAEFRTAGRLAAHVSYVAFTIFLDIIVTVLLICAVTGIIVGTAFAIYIKNNIDPTFDDSLIITSTNKTSQLYYMDYTDRENRIGEPVLIEDQQLIGAQYSVWADYSSLPQDLINAFIAIEDERFWSHNGVDWFRTIAAAANQVLHIKDTFGGSTITQQLVKNATGDDDFTIQRKIQEILRAMNLESTHSKEEIITMYLNIISLSQNCYGVQSAAWTYFGKDVSELSLIECAALAAIPKSPYQYDPIRHPEANKQRRQYVLNKMLELGKITRAQYDEVFYADLQLNVQRSSAETSPTSWYTDAVIADVVDAYAEKYNTSKKIAELMIYNGGLNIYTVMDPKIQHILETAYLNDKFFPKNDTGIQPQSAAIVIDPATGDILGLVGGRGEKTGSRILNRATQSKRPVGSAMKPLSVYAPAIESGVVTWGSVFDDVPVSFGNYTDPSKAVPWPKNSTLTYEGLTTVYDALRKSTNTIAVRVLQALGIENSFSFLTEKLHLDIIDSYTSEAGIVYSDKSLAPLALGQLTYGLTVRDITTAYQIFANKGVYNYSRTFIEVTDSEGNVILTNNQPSEVVISEQTATIMTKLLEAVVDDGTARKITLKKQIDVAGKTGTTNADYDRWFIGYTPYYLCGVWFGYDLNQTLTNFSVNPAMTIWDNVMALIHEDIIANAKANKEKLKTFTDASGLIKCTYCKDSGKLMTEACKLDPRGDRSQTGYFTVDTAPTEECDVHVIVNYDKTTGGVASQYCNSKNIVKYSLIRVEDRNFPKQIVVTDAQYVYRALPSNVAPAGWWGVPFFQNILKDGEYCGTSNVSKPFNRFCYQHYDFNRSTGIDTSRFADDVRDTETTTTAETTKETTTAETTTAETTTAETTTNDAGGGGGDDNEDNPPGDVISPGDSPDRIE